MIKQTARQQKRLKFLKTSRFIGSLPKVYLQVLELLFQWDNHQNSFKAYQAYIADRVGCTREYICTVLGDLEFWGFIYTKRIYDTYKIYCVNRYFHQEEVRRSLSFLFETFWHWPRRYLFSLCLLTSIILPFTSYVYLEAAAANSYSIDSKRSCSENKTSSQNKKSYSLVNKAVPKKGKSLMTFTKEQMEHIAKAGYSNAAIAHATKELAAGKNIADPFRYFKAICHRFDTQPQKAASQAKPINGTNRVLSSVEMLAHVQKNEQENPVEQRESEFTFCMKTEKNVHIILHERTGLSYPEHMVEKIWHYKENPTPDEWIRYVPRTIEMLDQVLERLSDSEREDVFKSNHTSDCICRELFPFKGIKKQVAAPPTPSRVDNPVHQAIIPINEKETNEPTSTSSTSRTHVPLDRTTNPRLHNSAGTDTISQSTPRERENMGPTETRKECIPDIYEETMWEEVYD